MAKKKVVIVGYPKSGNTWISRLVAELIEAPVVGFWNSDHNEIAIEGLHRESNFECYKSHHQFHELLLLKDQPTYIICVIRDPRDIVLSASNYFKHPKAIAQLPYSNLIYKAINKFMYLFFGNVIMKEKAINAVLFGNGEVHHWLRIPWKEHIVPFISNPNVHIIQYESMLTSPVIECQRILDFLNISKSETFIKSSIRNQSFVEVKKKFEKENMKEKAIFLRKGEKEYWKHDFSEKEKKLFSFHLSEELTKFNYKL